MDSHVTQMKASSFAVQDKIAAKGTDSGYDSSQFCPSSVSENESFVNRAYSGHDSMKKPDEKQMDSGYVSFTNPGTDLNQLNLEHSVQETLNIPREMTMKGHYTSLVVRDPTTWTSKDFENLYFTNSACKALWENPDEDGDVEVFEHARDGKDTAVLYSMYMADSVSTLNKKNLDMQTVLHIAAETCRFSTVRRLVTRGCDGALADIWGNTPLHIAAKYGKAGAIRALTTSPTKDELSHPRFKVPYKSLPQDNKDQMNHDGKTPLHLAAQIGNIECIKALADCKVDLDSRRLGDGYSALHIVIDNGDINSMKVLLENGADLEVRNFKGETPQQLAYLVGRPDMVDLCNEYGASPNQLLFAETETMDFSDEYTDSDGYYEDLSENLQRQTIS